MKLRPLFLAACCLSFFIPGALTLSGLGLLSLSACHRSAVEKPGGVPQRILSYAPSITETLFALGLGGRVVGVTDFCSWPPEVKQLPRVGDYLNPNFERILALRPDLVLTLKEQGTVSGFLDKNGIRHLAIDNESLAGVLHSFIQIGDLCGARAAADSLVASIHAQMRPDTLSRPRPRVLLCIGRDNPGGGTVTKVYAAGPRTVFGELIEHAGGVNAYTDTALAYPTISAEGVARLAPEVVIDLMAAVSTVPPARVVADWNCLPMLPAVKNGRVFCPTGAYLSIPGPRLGLVLRDFRRIIGGPAR